MGDSTPDKHVHEPRHYIHRHPRWGHVVWFDRHASFVLLILVLYTSVQTATKNKLSSMACVYEQVKHRGQRSAGNNCVWFDQV